MTTQRFLVNFAYLGTKYHGVQRQMPRPGKDYKTVQGVLEHSMEKRLRTIEPVAIYLSSRTDSGVHATNSTFHVDLQHSSNVFYKPDIIVLATNLELAACRHDIWLRSCQVVPSWFNARFLALSRTYVYRIGVIIKPFEHSGDWLKFVPVFEHNCCAFIQGGLDVDKVRRATELMTGEKDFRSFQSVSKSNIETSTVRTVHVFQFKLSATPHLAHLDSRYDDIAFYEFEISARGFLYRQVRRMVGAALAFGYGKINEADIEGMFDNPDKDSWCKNIKMMGPEGLFLTNVAYDPAHLQPDAELPPDIRLMLEEKQQKHGEELAKRRTKKIVCEDVEVTEDDVAAEGIKR